MKKTLVGFIRNESGLALPAVLIMLIFSGLLITPLLAHVSTGLRAGSLQEEKVALSYAADAGLEDVLWKTNNEDVPLEPYDYETEYIYSLPQGINGKAVTMSIKQVWPLTGLESDENGTTPPSCLLVTGGITKAQEGKYEVQISYDDSQGNLYIDRVGVWLPAGFEYVVGSSSGITTNEPIVVDWHGGKVLTWDFQSAVNFTDLPPPEPPGGGFTPGTEYPATRILYFNVTPVNKTIGGSYSWVRTTNSALYLSWDTGCNIYQVSSTATDNDTGKSLTVEAYTYVGKGAGGMMGGGGSQVRGDYRAIGNTLMLDMDENKRRETLLGDSSATISNIPDDAEVVLAYLYWSGWRELEGDMEADRTCGLKINDRSVYFNEQGEPVEGELIPDPDTELLRPNGTGSITQCYRHGDWFYNYRCVDEVEADDASTYVYSKNDDTRMDTYRIQNHSQGTGTINSVTVYARARAYNSETCADMRMQIAARTYSTAYYGSEITLIGNAGWDNYSKTWTTNPDTGGAWTWDEIDDLQIGIKLYDDGPGYPQCTQVYAEVNYLPVFQGITAAKWWLLENDSPNYSYSCFRDVTELVRLITPVGNGTYTVAGVSGSTDSEWSYAAWSIFIIYSSPSEKAHQLFLYDHYLYSDMNRSHTFSIEGFLAPEDAEASLTCFVGEGDEFYTGDYIQFNNNYLYDEINPQDNVWNGKSSGLGGEFIDGVDIDTFNVSGPIINPGDTAAEVKLTTGIDSWNLIYIILSFRSELGGLTPNSLGIITYNYQNL
jgi:hypothetical protein